MKSVSDFRAVTFACLVAASSICSFIAAQVTRTVPGNFATIQSAINASSNGDTVLVGPGTWFGLIDFSGRDIRVASTNGPDATILNGMAAGSVVRFHSGESSAAVLEGFTVRNGSGGVQSPLAGGGISITNSSPTIRRCIIRDNVGAPGPASTNQVSPIAIGLLPLPVQDPGAPGGILLYQSASLIEHCDVLDNQGAPGTSYGLASGMGLTIFPGWGSVGGMRVENSGSIEPLVRRCRFAGNVGGRGHDGAHINANQNPNFGAAPGGHGGPGALVLKSGRARFDACVFEGNHGGAGGDNGFGPGFGGAGAAYAFNGTENIFMPFADDLRLVNCIVRDNVGGMGGLVLSTDPVLAASPRRPSFAGGVYGRVSLLHCTIVDNVMFQSTLSNAPTAVGGTVLSAVSTIFWGNNGNLNSTQVASPILTSCIVEGATPNGNVINVDPLFRDRTNGDLHLTAASPAIDAAPTVDPLEAGQDIDGEPRPIFGLPDIGADEFVLGPCKTGNVTNSNGDAIDVLSLNGGAGSDGRVVRAANGMPLAVSLLQPPTNVAPSHWALFGVFDVPLRSDVFLVAASIGQMCFTPLEALAGPGRFTLADSLNVLPSRILMDGTPAPWSHTIQNGIPFPLRVTIQGIIEIGPGVWRPTNAVVVQVDP